MERLEQAGPVNADARESRPEIGIGDVEDGPARGYDAADEALDPGARRFDPGAQTELGEHGETGRLQEKARAERPRRRESLEQMRTRCPARDRNNAAAMPATPQPMIAISRGACDICRGYSRHPVLARADSPLAGSPCSPQDGNSLLGAGRLWIIGAYGYG